MSEQTRARGWTPPNRSVSSGIGTSSGHPRSVPMPRRPKLAGLAVALCVPIGAWWVTPRCRIWDHRRLEVGRVGHEELIAYAFGEERTDLTEIPIVCALADFGGERRLVADPEGS